MIMDSVPLARLAVLLALALAASATVGVLVAAPVFHLVAVPLPLPVESPQSVMWALQKPAGSIWSLQKFVVSIGAKYSFHAPGGFGAGASVLSGQRQLHDTPLTP